jgi:putative lipoic acid-binding regulatory protein
MTNREVAEQIYPCQFPIKVIGETGGRLEKVIIEVMSSLGEVIDPDDMSMAHSKNKKFLSITFGIVARSRAHVEQVYSGLSSRKEVKMVL